MWNVTRVDDPGFDLVLAQDAATVEALKKSPWLHPAFVTDEWELRVGSSAILLQQDGKNVLVDPWLAFDDPARWEPRINALAAAGVNRDDVHMVISSHVDGLGANLEPGSSRATFPKADYLVPAAELERDDAAPLRALPRMTAVVDDGEIAPGLAIRHLPGHNAAHIGVVIDGRAIVIGHLFLHPGQIANPDVATEPDPTVIRQTRRALLDECADSGMVVIGALFAAPGMGRVERDGERWALVPITDRDLATRSTTA